MWYDIPRVTAIPLAWTGYLFVDGAVGMDCEFSYLDADATRAASQWIAIYLSYVDVGATSKKETRSRGFRIGDGRGGDEGAYVLGLRGVRGPRASVPVPDRYGS